MAAQRRLVDLNGALDTLKACKVSSAGLSEAEEAAFDELCTLDGYVFGLGDRVARGESLRQEWYAKLVHFSVTDKHLITGLAPGERVHFGSSAQLEQMAIAIANVAKRILEVACR